MVLRNCQQEGLKKLITKFLHITSQWVWSDGSIFWHTNEDNQLRWWKPEPPTMEPCLSYDALRLMRYRRVEGCAARLHQSRHSFYMPFLKFSELEFLLLIEMNLEGLVDLRSFFLFFMSFMHLCQTEFYLLPVRSLKCIHAFFCVAQTM